MTDDARYAHAVVIYDDLRAVIPKFREKKAFLRETSPVTPEIQKELGPSAPIPRLPLRPFPLGTLIGT
jgi:hypothetical protein